MILNVGNLDRHTLLHSPADCRLADVDMTIPDRGNDSIVHSIGRTQPEFPAGVVEHIDGSSLGIGELGRLGDYGGQHGLEVSNRIYRLADLAKRPQLAD